MNEGFEKVGDQNNSAHCEKDICAAFNSLGLTKVPEIVFKKEYLLNLFLDYNDLCSLPKELSEECCHLQILSVVGNNLTELPTNIGRLKLLEELYVNENCLKYLPEELTRCFKLQTINFVGNSISKLPDQIETLTCLTKIFGDENVLEKFPQNFGLLCSLQVAEFSCNQIKELPKNFGCLTKLQVLNISSNKLSSLPETFSHLPCLIELDLSNNNLSTLPDTLRSSHCLRKFFAETNAIETSPPWINELPSLEELSLKDNQLKGKPLADSFGETSKKLQIFELAGNFISDLPATMGCLTQLESVHLGSVIGELERRNFQNGNWLWKIPESIVRLVNLRELHIDENQLCELPHDFGDLVNLETLDLGQNRLSDLPASFGHLISLRVCQLSKNFLEILPSNFGELLKLEDLRLDNNNTLLSLLKHYLDHYRTDTALKLAELPDSFSSLVNLKTLDLFNNNLEEVPDCLPKLKKLVRLDISENNFGMHHLLVPQVVMQNKYSPRDPSQSDNWRGRPRQDIVQVDIQTVELPDESYGKIPDKPETEETSFNSRAFQNAVRKNMSLWKSHTDTISKREKFVHPQLYRDMMPLHRGENEQSNLKRSQKDIESSQSAGIISDSPSLENADCNLGVCTEDWDKECALQDIQNNQYNESPEFSTGTMFGFKPSYISDSHLYIPSDYHVLNHVHRSCASIVEEGQFDDVE